MSIICQCEQLIREIVYEITRKENYDKPFLLYVTKRLKFENEEGWISLCSLMDVIGDTELAKKHFFNYGIDGPTKILDYGEQYLRLYGILNALYLQKSAIFEFLELLYDKKKFFHLGRFRQDKFTKAQVEANLRISFEQSRKSESYFKKCYLFIPPALFNQYVSRVAAGPPLPLCGAQRRDQHRQGQLQLDEGARRRDVFAGAGP